MDKILSCENILLSSKRKLDSIRKKHSQGIYRSLCMQIKRNESDIGNVAWL